MQKMLVRKAEQKTQKTWQKGKQRMWGQKTEQKTRQKAEQKARQKTRQKAEQKAEQKAGWKAVNEMEGEKDLQEIPKHIHFIGIGGAGMSGIAQVLMGMGYQVSGSDLKESNITERLKLLGAEVHIGHAPEHVDNAELVVVSSAIPENNPELREVRKKSIPVIQRGEMLAWLMRQHMGVAVAGSHGKTTTTSMMGLVLEKNELDPTIIVGGELNDIGGNAKLGSGKYLVAEADESDASFLKLNPEVVIVTNIENDHLDYYGSMNAVKNAFRQFIASVPDNGLAVLCLDDEVAGEIIGDLKRPHVTYGKKNRQADYFIDNVCLEKMKSSGDVYYRGEKLGRLELEVPGEHNLLNALAVIAVSRFIGLAFSDAANALKCFKGAGRRFQLLGEVDGVKVVDDYAHHPSELKATIKAARQVSSGRIIAVFQPHRFTRTSLLYNEFGSAFDGVDFLIINKIYSAGEKPMEGVSAALIVDAVKKHGKPKTIYLEEMEDIVRCLLIMVKPGDLVLTLGAGDIWTCGVELVTRLRSAEII